MLHHVIVQQPPVRVVERSSALQTPPDQVPRVDNELCASALDLVGNFMGDPLTARKFEHCAVDAGK